MNKSDHLTVRQVAKKQGVDLSVIKQQLKMGTKEEMEHTDDPKVAARIALDHLVENPHYYSILKRAGL